MNLPPLTDESVRVAWLPAPPLTAANALGKPAVFSQALFSDTVPAPARFEQPPPTVLLLLAAVLNSPPPTLAPDPLAAF